MRTPNIYEQNYAPIWLIANKGQFTIDEIYSIIVSNPEYFTKYCYYSLALLTMAAVKIIEIIKKGD